MARHLRSDKDIDKFIAKALSNAVRALLNLAIDKVEVYERNGQLARTCWVTIRGRRYVFTYNYRSGQIDLKVGSLQGAHRFSFGNNTSPAAITREAAGL
ncbi:hypothetical protein RHE_CH01983 [Rhizobium etli CFN 42]|uniref:Integron cassette protein VCH-CASS1 chain domain-containing protein n=1 Tax=Rhizobium etli (strain ATCC 51251 / DSM 11541 / JCM 21823 / NBRC 15573 / CFN 42) TaxID=347834 RepID=Q2K8R8_RHIEC|nr:hypothetical protein [Rhizobium etli]ABC90768.1 hypothetical protein RHE_CH01983 [Rhizobium etli CFN 42]